MGRLLLTAAILLCLLSGAKAETYSAYTAGIWMQQFADALQNFTVLNEPAKTEDPAREGAYWIEYEFGTVCATTSENPAVWEIQEITAETPQMTDCRGKRVGMALEDLLSGQAVGQIAGGGLTVLDSWEDGWCWAYGSENGLYGLEWIAYDRRPSADVLVYTLTYVLGKDARVEKICMKQAFLAAERAEEDIQTVQELAEKQRCDVLLEANAASELKGEELILLGAPVYELVERLGKPLETQMLPSGGGRLMVYEGAAVHLGLDEQTGVEVVQSLTVTGSGLIGPRGICKGMDIREAAARFRCDQDLFSLGGVLYEEGENRGDAPYGELLLQGSNQILCYACLTEDGKAACFEIGFAKDSAVYWRIYNETEDK